MKAIAELQVVALGDGISLRKQVNRIISLLETTALQFEAHAFGTDIEGDLEEILTAVKDIHKTLHDEGTVRLMTTLKLETRTDKAPSLAGKRL